MVSVNMINFMCSIHHSRNEQFKMDLFLVPLEQSDPWPRARDCGAKATGQGRVSSENPLMFSQRKAGKTMIYITLYREMSIWRTLTLQNACGRLKRKAVVSQVKESHTRIEKQRACEHCFNGQLKKYSVRF